jgi:uncharacterized OB-fold protein
MAALEEAFRAGLARGELLLQHCNACGKPIMYPRYACPFCQSEALGWQTASGRGILHSYTVLRLGAPNGFEDQLPYALGVIKLEEGQQMLGRLVASGEGDWSAYACDAAVEFASRPEGAPTTGAAWFRLSEGGS